MEKATKAKERIVAKLNKTLHRSSSAESLSSHAVGGTAHLTPETVSAPPPTMTSMKTPILDQGELDIAMLVARRHDELLKQLEAAPTATIEAQLDEGCMPGTREDVLATIKSWASDPNSSPIYGLIGGAGVGKSAVSRTLCRLLRELGLLGGSFFCSRQSPSQQDARHILPTLCRELAVQSGQFAATLVDAISHDPDAVHSSIDHQFTALLIRPLTAVIPNSDIKAKIMVIDGIDECTNLEEIRILLHLIIENAQTLPIRFLFTSRPEATIREVLSLLESNGQNIFYLDRSQSDVIRKDIRTYLLDQLGRIPERRRDLDFPKSWPSGDELDGLVALSDGLFIYASTACRYINAPGSNPKSRLHGLLNNAPGAERSLMGGMDAMYSFILNSALASLDDPDKQSLMMRCISTIICVQGTLRLSELAGVVDGRIDDTRAALSDLHSAISVPDDPEQSVSIVHATFREYVTTRGNSDVFSIDTPTFNAYLTSRCLDIMQRQLCFNIANFQTSYVTNHEHLSDMRFSEPLYDKLSNGLGFACMQWYYHWDKSNFTEVCLGQIASFLQTRFPYWLEVVSVSELLSPGQALVKNLRASMPTIPDSRLDLVDLVQDMDRFFLEFYEPIAVSAPHIYVTALPLASDLPILSKHYGQYFSRTLIASGLLLRGDSSLMLNVEQPDTPHSLAIASDGTWMCSGLENGAVYFWDPRTGEAALNPIQIQSRAIRTLAISPNRLYIVCGLEEPETVPEDKRWCIGIWDARTGDLVMNRLRGHKDRINSVAVSPDGLMVASASSDSSVRVWDTAAGQLIASIPHDHPVVSATFSPDSHNIVSCCGEDINVWVASTGQLVIGPLQGHAGDVRSVAFSPDGSQIVSGAYDGTLCVWNAQTGEVILRRLQGHTSTVRSVSFSLDGRKIVSASNDTTIRIWSAETGDAIACFTGHSNQVYAALFMPDGKHIASCSSDQTVRIWHLQSNTPSPHLPTHQLGGTRSVSFSSDGFKLISGSEDTTINIWNVSTRQLTIPPLRGHTHWVNSAIFSLDGLRIVSCSRDKTICVWDASSGEMITAPLTGHSAAVNTIAFSSDGLRFVSSSNDWTARIWDAQSTQQMMTFIHNDMVRSAVFSPDGDKVATAAFDHNAYVWNAQNGELLAALTGHASHITSVAFSPCGRQIVTTSHDGTVRTWDASSGESILSFTDHGDWVTSAVFSPNGQLIASASFDHTVRIWEKRTGINVMPPLVGHTDCVESLAFSPDGTMIVTGCGDGVIRLWNVQTLIDENRNEERSMLNQHGYSRVDVRTPAATTWATSATSVNVPTCAPEPASLCLDLLPAEEVYGPIPEHDPNSQLSSPELKPENKIPTREPSPRALYVELELVEEIPSYEPEPRSLVLDLVPLEESAAATPTQHAPSRVDERATAAPTWRISAAYTDVPSCVPEPASLYVDLIPSEEVYGPIREASPNPRSASFDLKIEDAIPTREPSSLALHVELKPVGGIASAGLEKPSLAPDLAPLEDISVSPPIRQPVSNFTTADLHPSDGSMSDYSRTTVGTSHHTFVDFVRGAVGMGGHSEHVAMQWPVSFRNSTYNQTESQRGIKPGWIVSPDGRLLLWIPSALRRGLCWQGMVDIMGNAPENPMMTTLDLSNFACGESWTEAWSSVC